MVTLTALLLCAGAGAEEQTPLQGAVDCTVHGFDTLTGVLEFVASDFTRQVRVAGGPGTVLLMRDGSSGPAGPAEDSETACIALLAALPREATVLWQPGRDLAPVKPRGPVHLAELLQVPGNGAVPGEDLFRRIRRALGALAGCPEPRTLVVLADLEASLGDRIDETTALALRNRVRVIVAAPESPFVVPPQDSMHAGALVRRVPWDPSMAVFAEGRTPELALLGSRNAMGVFLYEPYVDRRLSERLTIEVLGNGVPVPIDVEDIVARVKLSYALDWPEDVGESMGSFGSECTGFPPVPSGFGYWPLTRLTSATGGKYLVTSFAKSHCPFRASYDRARMRALQPSLHPGDGWGVRPKERATLESLWKELEDSRIALHGPTFGPEGGIRGDAVAAAANLQFTCFHSVSECRTDARKSRVMAQEAMGIVRRIDEWRRREDSEGSKPTARMLGCVGLVRMLALRARFHLLEQAAALERVTRDDIPRDGGVLVLRCHRRVTRFWGGAVAAREEATARAALVHADRSEAFREAFEETVKVMSEWEGTPFGAVARSGALWTVDTESLAPGLGESTGELEDPDALPPTSPPGTPTSGGSGGSTPR